MSTTAASETRAIEHTARTNLFRRSVTYRLFDDRIEADINGRVQILPLRDITAVHAIRVVGTSWEVIRRCRLSAGSTRRWQLQSAYPRFMSGFEDRSLSYDPFLRALVDRVSCVNATAVFLVGSPLSSWLGWLLGLVLCAGMTLAAVPIMFSDFWSGLVMLASSLSAGPVCWTMVSKGRAHAVGAERFLNEACG